jgi:predicted amidophosphoribosyltransferase
MPCNGICICNKASGRYVTGNKRCNRCNLFVKWEGLWCPCCGYKLRTRPRVSKFKEKLREQKGMAQAKRVVMLYQPQSV